MEMLHQEIINLLKDNHLTIATAESLTAGMISSYLCSIPGASEVVKGGLVVYTNFAKTKLANIKEETINKYGAISSQTAEELARNVCKILKTNIGLSITGNAGPTKSENKPVGLAYLGICIVDKVYLYELHAISKSRNDIRIEFTHKAFVYLLELLKKVIK